MSAKYDVIGINYAELRKPDQRIANLGFLRLELLVVRIVLEPAAAASAEMRARSHDAIPAGRETSSRC